MPIFKALNFDRFTSELYMSETLEKPLKILDASAGSGKTYSLVKEYLKIMLVSDEGYTDFSEIIAMTFTNKAAMEMKIRLIRAMDQLSNPEQNRSKVQSLLSDLKIETGLAEQEITKRIKNILHKLLHQYEDFNVQTIDKFNLRLIRSFSRDLDLPSNFEVILDERQVIEQVVDLLLDSLNIEKEAALTRLVLDYAQHNLDEGEKWNFRQSLISFAENLKKEAYKPIIDKLLEMDFSSHRLKETKDEMSEIRAKVEAKMKPVLALYRSLNIPVNLLPEGSNTDKFFSKLEYFIYPHKDLFGKTIVKVISNETPPKKEFPEELKTCVLEFQKVYEENELRYEILKAFSKNFFNMALLQKLALALDSVKKSEQLIRISEFNTLIAALVQNEEAPFIYERLGTRFKHFLLDEFQDTSRLQWLNLVPLIYESLGYQRKNLIVGDPKQSIYRFKNGVAEQFVALPGIYNPEKNPNLEMKSRYFQEAGAVHPLNDNWRSAKEIVEFNNEFFPFMKEMLSNEGKLFYSSILQNPRSEETGYVEILSRKKEKDEATDQIEYIISKIQECEEDGFLRSDICLLSDDNKKANNWAIRLSKLGYKVISPESLLIYKDIKVKITISYLKLRLNPSNINERKRFVDLYYKQNRENAFEQYRSFFEQIEIEEKTISVLNFDRFIADIFETKSSFFFHYENLYDLVESFFNLMKWEETRDPYLHHFSDFVHDFELAKGPDLSVLLDTYNDKKGSLAIQQSESHDAIRIMTIHKSKGLEFPIVIMPDLNFDYTIRGGNKYLIEVDDLVLYSTVSKDNPIPEVREFKSIEEDQLVSDKINLLYVGFTRPIHRLYVNNLFDDKHLGAKVHECLSLMANIESDNESLFLIKGIKVNSGTKIESPNSLFIPTPLDDHLWFPDISLQDRETLEETNLLSDEQRFGNQFHLAMAAIPSESEIESILLNLQVSGQIEDMFFTTIRDKIVSLFQNPVIKELFKDVKTVLCEQSLIINETETLRPDRILVKKDETIILDFKTGIPTQKNVKQMAQYKKTITEMGYQNVRAYLLYTNKLELIEVG